jgi:hypothetical protein
MKTQKVTSKIQYFFSRAICITGKIPKLYLSIATILVVILTTTLSSHSQELPQIQCPENISRGSTITCSIPPQSIVATSKTLLLLDGQDIESFNVSLDKNQKFLNTVEFNVPESLNLGKISAKLKVKQADSKVKIISLPKSLNVVGSSGLLSPEIKSISRSINFPDEKNNTYSFSVIGKGFSIDSSISDNKLVLTTIKDENGELTTGELVEVCWKPEDKGCSNKIQGEVKSSRELKFSQVPEKYIGKVGVQVGVGENFSNIYSTFLSPVLKETPKDWSLYITIGLIVLVLAIQATGILRNKDGKGKNNSFLKGFFVEPETNTFSLSRFQFYVWTLTAILGYLYLFLSQNLIQSKIQFIDIPSGLPAIVGISATTTFLSQGISSTKGTKGAGEIDPKWSDLITTGGIVAPERLQFLIWTVLGAFAFLFITFFQNSEQIQDLPQVPQGFLQLMGVSSFGYVGGKLARKAGPVLTEVIASNDGNTLTLDVRGARLSEDAICKVENNSMLSSMIRDGKPKIVTSDDSNEVSLAKHLQLGVVSPIPDWVQDICGKNFQIVNPDGQYAEHKIQCFQGVGQAPAQGVGQAPGQSVILEGRTKPDIPSLEN